MNHTVKLALEHDVAVGAHPSFPDLNGFGRRNMNATSAEVKPDLQYQGGAMGAFTGANSRLGFAGTGPAVPLGTRDTG